MSEDASFGRWLQQRRKALGLTQAELAQCVGCATVTIHKIELEERRPSTAIAERLAACLQIADGERRAFVRFARGETALVQPTPLPPHVLPLPPQPLSASALRAPSAGRHNVPVQRERLIGRDREVAQVRDLLLRDDVSLVTLTGPGGVGKSRLALYVAAQLVGEFQEGVWFVPLGTLNDPQQVLPAIARSLGMRDSGIQPLSARLDTFVRGKHLLLVLDNFEHLLAAAATIADRLAFAPSVKVLVTSRTVLRVADEYEYLVPALPLPSTSPSTTIAMVSASAAVQLFVQRAQTVQPTFELTPGNVAAVATVCHRLDGLPLAIELAAARSNVLTPAELDERLGQGIDLLSGGRRDLPIRQQTIWNTISWSYHLASPEEQALCARLSVFEGGWTLEAVEEVCAEATTGVTSVVETLQSLLHQSLVWQETLADGTYRFGYLETIRAYARAQLRRRGEELALQRRHAQHFARFAQLAAPHLHARGLRDWLARLDHDYPNFRASLHWMATHGEVNLAAETIGALLWYWDVRGMIAEGVLWHSIVDTVVGPVAPDLAARRYVHAAYFAYRQGKPTVAEQRATAILLNPALQTEDRIVALNVAGLAATEQSRLAAAHGYFETALELANHHGLPRYAAEAEFAYGVHLLSAGKLDESVAMWQRAYAGFEMLDHVRYMGIILVWLGFVSILEGKLHEAARQLSDGMQKLQDAMEVTYLVGGILGCAVFATATNQPHVAAQLFGAASSLAENIGFVIPNSVAPLITPYREQTSHQLSDEEFAQQWKQGSDMPLEAAVDLATKALYTGRSGGVPNL